MAEDNDPKAGSTPVSKMELFAIGLSAGFCAVVFPRVASVMSTSAGDNVNITLSGTVMAGMGAVILMVAMATYWLNVEERRSAKEVFISALAIPSLLSGSIQMADLTNGSTSLLAMKDARIKELTTQLSTTSGITIQEGQASLKQSGTRWEWGIAAAHAGNDDGPAPPTARTTFGFQSKYAEERYVVVVKQSPDRETLQTLAKQLGKPGMAEMKIMPVDQGFVLTSGAPAPQSQAMLNAVAFKKMMQNNPDGKDLPISILNIAR